MPRLDTVTKDNEGDEIRSEKRRGDKEKRVCTYYQPLSLPFPSLLFYSTALLSFLPPTNVTARAWKNNNPDTERTRIVNRESEIGKREREWKMEVGSIAMKPHTPSPAPAPALI